ncbi:hypothetical protein [Vampirovibrio chlorellavorus]|uniref:hypothetical protein n=1 Tax=Vampirovibrio chlorellavorus TaxID=758823 RepID=UPI0026F27E47|nr:hypothetical protein [Vampirovibrio chlorellavorus]
MTFRELAFQEDLKLSSALLNQDQDKNVFQALLENQSPVMKVWFFIMLINLGLFLVVVQ